VALTPIDLKSPIPNSGTRLLRSAYAVAAAGLLLSGCSTSGASAPTRSQTSSPSTSRPASPASPAQTVAVTASMASFALPEAVSRPTVFAAGEGLLVVGGLNKADTTTQAILRVALPGGSTTPAGRLPVPVHDAAGAVVNGRDVVFGGGSTAVTSAVQDVTPGSPPRVISHLPQPRADLVAASDGTAGYVLGGYDGVRGSTAILRTRDGRTFAVAGTLPVAVRYPAVAVSAGAIWLFGGELDGTQVADVQRIDLATGQGRVVGHLPAPLAHAGAFTLAGQVFVAGGRLAATATDQVLRFDPANLRFTAGGHLPAGRSDFGVTVVGDTAYLVGGESPKPVDTVIQVRVKAGGTP